MSNDYVNHPHRLIDVAPLPSRSPQRHRSHREHHARRGWGTIIAFAATFGFILALTLGGLGLPSPTNLPTQTSNHR
jgi:hypothetical protein